MSEKREAVLECFGFSARAYNVSQFGGREAHAKGVVTATFMGADGLTLTIAGWRGPLSDATKVRVTVEQVTP